MNFLWKLHSVINILESEHKISVSMSGKKFKLHVVDSYSRQTILRGMEPISNYAHEQQQLQAALQNRHFFHYNIQVRSLGTM